MIQILYEPFDAHCCHINTAIKHPVPDRVKPSFVIYDIRALWRSGLSVRVPGCQKLKMATVGIKWLQSDNLPESIVFTNGFLKLTVR